MRRRVVITGIGCITPMGTDVETVWEGLKQGASGVGYTSIFDASRFPTKISAEVRDWDVSRGGRGPRGLEAARPAHAASPPAPPRRRSRDSGILDAKLDPTPLRRLSGQRRRPAGFSVLRADDDQRPAGRGVRPGAVYQGRPGVAAPDDRTGAGAQHAGRPPGGHVQRPGPQRQLPDGLRRQQPGHRRGGRDHSPRRRRRDALGRHAQHDPSVRRDRLQSADGPARPTTSIRPRPRARSIATATASCWAKGRRWSCWKSWSMPAGAARRFTAR